MRGGAVAGAYRLEEGSIGDRVPIECRDSGECGCCCRRRSLSEWHEWRGETSRSTVEVDAVWAIDAAIRGCSWSWSEEESGRRHEGRSGNAWANWLGRRGGHARHVGGRRKRQAKSPAATVRPETGRHNREQTTRSVVARRTKLVDYGRPPLNTKSSIIEGFVNSPETFQRDYGRVDLSVCKGLLELSMNNSIQFNCTFEGHNSNIKQHPWFPRRATPPGLLEPRFFFCSLTCVNRDSGYVFRSSDRCVRSDSPAIVLIGECEITVKDYWIVAF